jgi:hypothetical protein
VPVEAAGVRQAGHTGGQCELAQRQVRVAPSTALEPGLHLRPGGDTNQRVVERCRVAFQDGALAARVPDLDLRPILRETPGASRQRQFCAQLIELEGEDLTKARNAVALQHDISADPQFQVVQRGLIGEPAPVHRSGERKHRRFESLAHLTKGLQLNADSRLFAHKDTVSSRKPHGNRA